MGVLTEQEKDELSAMLLGNCIFPAFLAISFFHCKNVSLKTITPPLKPSRNHKKKYGRPLTKYHVLNIEPMKKTLRTEGRSDEVGFKQSLHICRGHFKDYRDGKGLFGKYKGLYWWEDHARGSRDVGEIKKDYKIKL